MLVEDTENSRRKRCIVNVRRAYFNGLSPLRVRPIVGLRLTDATVDIDTLNTLSEVNFDWSPYSNYLPELLVFTAPFSGFYSVTMPTVVSNVYANYILAIIKIYVVDGMPTSLAALPPVAANITIEQSNVVNQSIETPVTLSPVLNLRAGQSLIFLVEFATNGGEAKGGEIRIEEIPIYTDRGST